MESSANEAGENSEKDGGRRVEYLGCRFTDVEFEDVEPGQDPLIPSYNNDNTGYTNNDKSLLAPHLNFELTEFTEHQTNQLFDNDTNPMIREITDQIDINFSAVAPLSDDLEIHDDLDQDRKATNMSCIDIDLNATHFSLKAEEFGMSDMSITDSIHSPKVAAAKLALENRRSNADDWVVDKENIIVNPYVAPLPAENFAVSDDNDDVLVFDGKKCKFQSDLTNKTLPNENVGVRSEIANKRRTIVYNNDQGDISVTQGVNGQILTIQENNTTTINNRKLVNKTRNNDSNISMTQAVSGNILMSAQEKTKPEKDRTMHFDDFADISVTQALPSNIFSQKLNERRKTVVYESNEGNLSMTEVVPANVIPGVAELKQTVLYENEDADISMTQAVPLNIKENKSAEREETLGERDNAVDVTSTLPTNILDGKRKTILFENDTGNISMTELVPTNLIIHERKEIDKRKTIIYEDECANISVTQAIPANLILSDKPDSDKRMTIVYGNNDDGDMSVTEIVSNKVVIEEIHDILKVVQNKIIADPSLAQDTPTNLENAHILNTDVTNKRRTIVFNDSQGNLSITQSLPDNMVLPQVADKRKTIIYQDEAADISVTQTGPVNFMQKANADYDISSNKIEAKEELLESKYEGCAAIVDTSLNDVKMEKTMSDVCGADEVVNMSITQAISNRNNNTSNKNTTIQEDKLGNLSLIKPIPTQLMSIQSVLEEQNQKNEVEVKLGETYRATNKSVIEPQDILIYEAAIQYTKVKEEDNETDRPTESDGIESSSSKVSESASDSTVSGAPGKNEVADDLKEDYDMDMNPSDDVKNNTSAVSVIENRINSSSSSPKHVKIQGISVKESILNDLLDMTDTVNADPRQDNRLMVQLTSDASSVTTKVINERGSQESYLLIKDSDEEQADKKSGTSCEEIQALEFPKLLPIEYQEEKHHGLVGKLQHKLSELKTFINQKSASKTKNFNGNSLDAEKLDEQEEIDRNGTMNRSKCKPVNKTENNADDTNALLDMLSHFTDTRVSRDFAVDDKKEASPLKVKGLIAIENKSEVNDTRRSLVPDRKSMIRSREDLLKDISMAQAMIDDEQESQMDESAEDTMIETQEEPSPPRRSPRLSHDVVKTLKFDEDDSIYETDISSHQRTRTTHHEMATSPLKKTAFGETIYIEDQIRDSKTKVIPGFLKDISHDLKELMNDLVKPTNDPIPFDTNFAKKSTSTHSTQIQANLLASSQIDLDPDLQSNAHSAHSVDERLASEMAALEKESVARTLQSQVMNSESHLKISGWESKHTAEPQKSFHSEKRSVRKVQDPNRVIVFDHQNPLNNVLLPAIGEGEVHKYNPDISKLAEFLAPEASETTPESESRDKEEQNVVESRMALHDNAKAIGDAGPPAMVTQSFMSDTSKPTSLDESVDAKQEVKEVEVNTMIVMKGNRDLLEASSSLTLVDDALARSAYDVEIDSNSPQIKSRSPVQVIFKIKEPESSVKLDSDLTSNDDDISEIQSKGKKRNYSPAKLDKNGTLPTEEVTPKPANKLQKVSFIAKTKKMFGIATKQYDRAAQVSAESSQDECSSQESVAPSEDMDISKRKSKQGGAAVTVQQLITEYNMDTTKTEQATLNREILAHLAAKAANSDASCSTVEPATLSNTEECKSLDVVSSFASSRRNFQSDPSDCEGLNSVSSESRRAQWQPELMHEISSKNLVTECESSVNVVSKIDVLPFMG